MFTFILKRLLSMIPILLVVATITFFLMRVAPGGPYADLKATSPEIIENINKKFHFDEPLYMQYLRYLGDVCKGDFGPSFKYPGRTVNEIIAMSFPVSLQLGLLSLAFALIFGVIAGMLASLKQNTFWDYSIMGIAMIGISIPNFVLGPLLILIFCIMIPLFPVVGWENFSSMILPAITLGAIYLAYIARLTRGGMLEIKGADFIRTARAKGLSESKIMIRHAFRGGILPVVSFLGPAVSWIVTQSLVVESIFNIPGLGRYFVNSALNRDYTMVMGVVIFYAAILVLMNLVVDVIYAVLDPRVKYD